LLLGPMLASAAGHFAGLTPGILPVWLVLPAYLGLGTLIGTRFSGMSLRQFTASLLAGLTITLIAVLMTVLAAVPVGYALNMPAAHAIVAFSPGGLETMVALGAAMGASPGFVAACHILRLVMLMVLIPLAFGQRREA